MRIGHISMQEPIRQPVATAIKVEVFIKKSNLTLFPLYVIASTDQDELFHHRLGLLDMNL